MKKDDVKKQVNTLIDKLEEQDTGHGFAIRSTESYAVLDAFARALVVKTLEEVGQDFVSRMRKAKESGPCTVQAVKGVTVDHAGWIDTEIQRIKEGA